MSAWSETQTGWLARRGHHAGLVLLALIVLALALVPFSGDSSLMRTLVEALALLTLAQMWNLLAGFAGLVSVGQQAFIGIGAYALIVSGNDLGVDPFLSVGLAGIVALAFALPTAALAFRLRGGYFAIGTWVIAEVYRLLVVNTDQLGGGTGQTLTAVQGIERSTRESVTYWLALTIALAAVAAVFLILRSRLGLALAAIRDDLDAASVYGVNVFRAKLLVWCVAALGCGLAGGLIYLNLLRVQPDAAFSINWTVAMIFIVLIGGIGTIEGPIVGTVLYIVARQTLAQYGTWFLVLLGTFAIVVMLFAPRGIWGVVRDRVDAQLLPVKRRFPHHRLPPRVVERRPDPAPEQL